MPGFLRAGPSHKREQIAAVWPHSIRHGREVATLMLIFIMGLAYAPTSPIILPFCLLYFFNSWCAASCYCCASDAHGPLLRLCMQDRGAVRPGQSQDSRCCCRADRA
jgi:hypothetical protein